MQPIRQRLLRTESIFFRMRAKDLEATIKRSEGTQFCGSFRKQNSQRQRQCENSEAENWRVCNNLDLGGAQNDQADFRRDAQANRSADCP